MTSPTSPTSPTSTTPTAAAPAPLHLEIRGMSCGHCVAAVERALATVPGAHAERVAVGSASVALEPGTPPDAIVAAVRDAGYDARIVPRTA